MKYFLDTEFHEYKKNDINTIELISIGIIREDGREFYMESSDFDVKAAVANTWLKENVLANLRQDIDRRCSNDLIASKVREWIGVDENIEFYGYYSDYDWVVFCWLFGRMIDLPKGFPMYCRDLKQTLDEKVNIFLTQNRKYLTPPTFDTALDVVKSMLAYPKQTNEHNALADAKWNYDLYKFLTTV